MKNVIAVTSCGAGGAAAITSWLVGYNDCFSMGYEMDLFRGPGGIYELYKMMDSNDLYLTHETFTKFDNLKDRVVEITKACEYNCMPLVSSKAKDGAGSNVAELLESFKNEFVDMEFYWSSHCYGLDSIRKQEQLIRVNRCVVNSFSKKVGNFLIDLAEKISANPIGARIDLSLPQKTFLKKADVNSAKFFEIAKCFLKNLMKLINDKKTFVCLWLLTSSRISSFEEQCKFFDNLKMIFLTRDPRDTFTGWTKRNWLSDEQVDIFIKIYKYLHADYPYCNHSRIMPLRFEDFVLNHEETSGKILDFIGVSKNSKVSNPKYNVENSKKNIGLWKSYPNQEVMDKIASELKDYLYET